MKFIVLHDFQRSSQLCPDVFASGIILIILYSQADIEMLKEYITFSLFMSWYNHFWILNNSSRKNSMNVVNCTLLNYLLDIDYWWYWISLTLTIISCIIYESGKTILRRWHPWQEMDRCCCVNLFFLTWTGLISLIRDSHSS